MRDSFPRHVYGNDLLALTGGQTVDCPLTTSFSVDGDSYRIQMNPRTGVAVYPQTDFVTVTYKPRFEYAV
jgi:hypothetical protein